MVAHTVLVAVVSLASFMHHSLNLSSFAFIFTTLIAVVVFALCTFLFVQRHQISLSHTNFAKMALVKNSIFSLLVFANRFKVQ